MPHETCPFLNEIPWLRHGFYDQTNPHAATKNLVGLHPLTEKFPQTLFLKQTHGDTIWPQEDLLADAAITDEPGLALAIKTADCCPILLVCTHSKQIAAIHAGWPGALNAITAKTVTKLVQNGAKPEMIIAAIGPCIHPETYPVRDDVRDKFAAQQPEALAHFTPFEDRWKLNVAGIVKQQLQAAHIGQIWQSPINTFTDPRYASYREYSGNPEMADLRNVSVIMRVV